VAYEDQPIVTQLLQAAPSIDVIPDIVYRYRMRDDRSSISQQTATVKDLRDRVAAWRESAAALQSMPRAVQQAWLQTLFDAHFNWYLISPGTVEDEYWDLIQQAVVELTDPAPAAVWEAAPPQNRVLLTLTRQGRRADVQEFVRQNAIRGQALFPSTVRPDGVLLHLPFLGDPDLPDELFVLREPQLELSHGIERISWTADELSLAGWAFVLKVDLAEHDARTELVLTGRSSGTERTWAATNGVPLVNSPRVSDAWADYHRGSFAVSVPTAELLAPSGSGEPDTEWDVSVRVHVAGFTVTQPVVHLFRNGAAGVLEQHQLPDGRRLHLSWRHRHPLHLALEAPVARVVDVTLRGRTLQGRVEGPGAERVSLVELTGVGLRTAPVQQGRFQVSVPPGRGLRPGQPATSTLRGVDAQGTHLRLSLPPAPSLPAPVLDGETELVAQADRLGSLQVAEWTHGVEGLEVAVTGRGGLAVQGVVRGPRPDSLHLTTTSPKATSAGAPVPVAEDGSFRAELDLQRDVHRFGRWPLPKGEHVLAACLTTGEDEVEVPVGIPLHLNRALPLAVRTDRLQGRVVRGPAGGLMVNLVRPLGEFGSKYQQNRMMLQAELSERGTATRRGVLFRAYFGEKATDNGLAIAEELARRGSDLPVHWAVQDYSVPVPEGSHPVLVNSPEWFELLGSVTYLVDNMYQPTYHRRPHGQVIVQTFHGYPFKQMGLPHWRHQQFSQAKIDTYGLLSSEWDYLVSPATYATELLTRDFGYHGEVLEIGYPRNDVLQSDRAESIRRTTRESLGLREDQTVVLYAPTFRDYLAKGDNRALMSDFLDFEKVAAEFGDDVVILMRGHAFHARTRFRVGDRATTIDVTDYPEVSDLYLAADACIADYSSLRFDFAVTGKPMIFLVPDLERYVESRGWLFDYEPTAPGPLVSTTDEVIEQLRDLPGLAARYAEQYARFRAEYLDLEDGHAAARFVDAVFVPRGDAPPADA